MLLKSDILSDYCASRKQIFRANFGNVSLGWSFDDWARENGLTSSGARIDKNKNLCSELGANQEPQRKKRCVDVVSFFEYIVLFRSCNLTSWKPF